jgi:RNA polymerase sigma-54 factor
MSGPGLSHDLRQRQNQSLVLAPQLRQSLKILQVAALDLRSEIQEELQSNPTLEELPPEHSSTESEDSPEENTPTEDEENSHEEIDFSKEFEILGKLDEDWRDYMSQAGGAQPYTQEDSEKRQHFMDSLVSDASLQEHLMRQAELTDTDENVAEALKYLIGSIDDRGFLTLNLPDAAFQTDHTLAELQEASEILSTFDPTGIGSPDIQTCLLAQLAVRERESSLSARIIRNHFDLLSRRRIPELSRKLGASQDDIQTAIEEIGKLDPAPGRRFAEDTNRVVEPDVTITKVDGEWKIDLNSDYIPRLRISSTYRELIAKGTLSKEEKEYLKERMKSGKFLIDSIEQRQRTIEKITREILKAQSEFFDHGISQLKPLTMTQIADIVGVHETTVSRAIANKYLNTPHGIFEFRYFFTTGYQSAEGDSVSNTSVKEIIADLIALEDRSSPFSDQTIVKKLQDKGLKLARRTVAKYREELGILPSNMRRDYS